MVRRGVSMITGAPEIPLAVPVPAAAPDGDVVAVRLSAAEMADLDAWSAAQRPRKTDRAEAIRELMAFGLGLHRDLSTR